MTTGPAPTGLPTDATIDPTTDPTTDPTFDPAIALLGFARALRAAGVAVSADRERGFLVAAAEVGVDDTRAVYWAGQATLCGSPDDLAVYGSVFAAWFGLETATLRPSRRPAATVTDASLDAIDATDATDAGVDQEAVRARASCVDVLAHRDVATLSAAERAHLARLFGSLRPRAPQRRDHRHRPARRGRVDARRTLRAQLRRLGEPGPVAWRRRGRRDRPVVLLVDVSGSMSAYADALLRLGHRLVTTLPLVEVFTVGTRLTPVTRALRHRDADRALVACGEAVPDWSGGTRLAHNLDAYLRRWGRRGPVRGAVVVVCSDGWERGDPADLAEQLRWLRALAHRVVWVNPHRGRPGYEPVQAGIVAVRPHVDALVAGHSLAAFAQVIEVIADA